MGNLQTTTNQTFLATQQTWKDDYRAIDMFKVGSVTDVVVMGKKAIKLSQMGKQANGRMFGELILESMVLSLVGFVGEESWKPEQVKQCAELIYEEFYSLSLPELKYFVDSVKKGRYKSKKNFKPLVLMEWVEEYIGEIYFERAQKYGIDKQAPTPKQKIITLPIEKMTGVSLKKARWMCAWQAEINEARAKWLEEMSQPLIESIEKTEREARECEAHFRSERRKKQRTLLEALKDDPQYREIVELIEECTPPTEPPL